MVYNFSSEPLSTFLEISLFDSNIVCEDFQLQYTYTARFSRRFLIDGANRFCKPSNRQNSSVDLVRAFFDSCTINFLINPTRVSVWTILADGVERWALAAEKFSFSKISTSTSVTYIHITKAPIFYAISEMRKSVAVVNFRKLYDKHKFYCTCVGGRGALLFYDPDVVLVRFTPFIS